MKKQKLFIFFLFTLGFGTKLNALVFNNPYPEREEDQKIYYSSFSEQPKTLDPARSYSSNEYQFIGQIYEPLLQYDYYKRPYTLVPLTATELPKIRFLDKLGHPTTKDKEIAYTIYTLTLKKGLFFQPHPAFAKDKEGKPLYLDLGAQYIAQEKINELSDFPITATRAVTVDDYIYQIKRLATPAVGSPIYGLMSEHIFGFQEFAKQLPLQKKGFLDLRLFPMQGLKKINDQQFEITLKGRYAQFPYWLAMPFFSPMPWEVDKFYALPGMQAQNISLDWYPVGTGPFMLTENNPNRRMVLSKNPNFRKEIFPYPQDPLDKNQPYAKHAGEKLPLIDKAIFLLEKESIPRWNKFLQGYYDLSAISNESFDQAIHITPQGDPILTKELEAKKMRLVQTFDPSVFYFGFNMLDSIVGGKSERARKLRQAISIALDYEEYIAIFLNGRGRAAHDPIPPGVFGHKEGQEGINPYLYEWDSKKRRAKRLSLEKAKKLMTEAGYPNGIDPKTGKALLLFYDIYATGGPDDKAQLDWFRKQFAKLGIDLNVRATLYNRFQDKIRSGNVQMYSWGWSADYPDPENFLFMFYTDNGTMKTGGQNASNYSNKTFDKLFDQLKNRPNDALRQKYIDEAIEILRHDTPWAFGFFTQTLILAQNWVYPVKPNTLSSNTLKYIALDTKTREQLRTIWNQSVLWPLFLILMILILFLLPVIKMYGQKEQKAALRSP